MEKKNLIVLFPGGKYSVDMPLLYYAKFKYEVRGYSVLKICYGDYYIPEKSPDDCMLSIKMAVLQQVAEIDFSKYEDIVFASKSIGTVIAGWLANELGINARNIFLTPVKDTLPFIKGENIIVVVAGLQDEQLDAKILRAHCELEGINLRQFEGIGHRLEVFDDMNINLDIVKQIVELY